MVNGTRTTYPGRLNKGFGSNFRVSSRVRQDMKKAKGSIGRNAINITMKDEESISNTLLDKNIQCITKVSTPLTLTLLYKMHTDYFSLCQSVILSVLSHEGCPSFFRL